MYDNFLQEMKQYKKNYQMNNNKKVNNAKMPGKIINRNLLRGVEGNCLK